MIQIENAPQPFYQYDLGGAGHLLFAKQPSLVEVYNDIDGRLVNMYRVIRDPKKFAEFQRLVNLTLYSREEFYYARENHQNQNLSDVGKARMFFVLMRQSLAGMGSNFGVSFKRMHPKSYALTIDGLNEIHQRLRFVYIENRDFRRIFELYDTPGTFFYCDPPYVPDTRKGGEYRYEMTVQDHEDLVQILLKIKGKAMLSCYDHSVYEPLSSGGWNKMQFDAVCYAVGKTRNAPQMLGEGALKTNARRVETVYFNYQPPQRDLFCCNGGENY